MTYEIRNTNTGAVIDTAEALEHAGAIMLGYDAQRSGIESRQSGDSSEATEWLPYTVPHRGPVRYWHGLAIELTPLDCQLGRVSTTNGDDARAYVLRHVARQGVNGLEAIEAE